MENTIFARNWSPQNGFGVSEIDQYRKFLLQETDTGILFPWGTQIDLKIKCKEEKRYFPEFITSTQSLVNRFFPMNAKDWSLEKPSESEEKSQVSFIDYVMGNDGFRLEVENFFVLHTLQSAFIETPTLLLMLIAGQREKFVSITEVIKIYWSVIVLVEANQLPLQSDERVLASAITKRNREFHLTTTFFKNQLFTHARFQNLFVEQNEKDLLELHEFFLQYTLRMIQIMEKYLIRVFDGRFTEENSVLLCTGRIFEPKTEEQIKIASEFVLTLVSCFENTYANQAPFFLESSDQLGFLPNRKDILDRIASSKTPFVDYSHYLLWFVYATRYLQLEYTAEEDANK